MFPNEESPSYGVFVKNFIENFQDKKFQIHERTLIRGKKSGLLLIFNYIRFFFEIVVKSNFYKYDIIYVHYMQHSLLPLNFWFKKRGKLILNAHGTDLTNSKKLYRWMRKLNGRVIRKADLIVVPSLYFVDKIKEIISNGDNIYVYPSGGINTDLFQPEAVSLQLKYRIGYLGRLDRGKGVEVLLKAFSNLDFSLDLKLELVGSGSEDQKLRKITEKLGINTRVTFLGVKSQKDLPKVLANWDVLVFPSELEESLGLVGLEAMACALPVIGSDAAGIKTYLKDKINGLSFIPGDTDDLTSKLHDFYHMDSDDIEKLKKNAIITASKYDRQIVNQAFKRRIEILFLS